MKNYVLTIILSFILAFLIFIIGCFSYNYFVKPDNKEKAKLWRKRIAEHVDY